MVGNDFGNSLKKISTPWKIALERAKRISKCELPQGIILDPACGSATQLGAYTLVTKIPAIGIEIDEGRVEFARDNLSSILSDDIELLSHSQIICSDGLNIPHELSESKLKISLLHIDPARPNNMQEHTIEEMKPNPIKVIENWKTHLGESDKTLAIIIDLSPRLSRVQIKEISEQITSLFPGISQTWEWASQGRGRIDRLSVWIGKIASREINSRFVRIMPEIDQDSIIVEGNISTISNNGIEYFGKVENDMWISILDSALVSSNLSEQWLDEMGCNDYEWISKYGRRPKIIHKEKLIIPQSQSKLVSASGKIVEIFEIDKIDELIEKAIKLNFSKLKLRIPLEPQIHPMLQSKLDNVLKINSAGREGFVCSTSAEIMCLCSLN